MSGLVTVGIGATTRRVVSEQLVVERVEGGRYGRRRRLYRRSA